MNQTVLNLEKICRACLKEKKDMTGLFQNKTNKMYTACTTIKLQSNDELPQQICTQCLQQVKQFYAFKNSCLDSDGYLRQYLKELKTQRLKQEIIENLQLSQELGIIGNSMETIDEGIVDLTDGLELPKKEIVDKFEIIDLDSVLKQQIDTPKQEVLEEVVNNFQHTEIIDFDPLENKKQIEQINFPLIDVPSIIKVEPKVEEIETPEVQMEVNVGDAEDASVTELQAALNEFNTKMYAENPVKTKNNNKKRFHCNRCDKTFDRRGHLVRHMPQHAEYAKEPYKCIKCKMEFSNLIDLSKHFETHGTVKKTAQCPKCNQIFPTFNRLLVHITMHVGEDGVTCTICHKLFINTFKLKQHFLTHVKDKPFTCIICGQSFVSKYCYKMHMKRHNGGRA